jgi:hypothetical protein
MQTVSLCTVLPVLPHLSACLALLWGKKPYQVGSVCYLQACMVANPVAAEVETEEVHCNSEALENAETYSNIDALASEEMHRNGEKPPVPVRPPALALKPASTTLAHSNSHNLPKPPVPV